MTSKLKVILITVVCTSIAWTLAIGAILHFQPRHSLALGSFCIHSRTKGLLIPVVGSVDDASSVEWEPHDAAFQFELVSSNNAAGATTFLLYSGTSRPPERIWFKTTPLSESRTREQKHIQP